MVIHWHSKLIAGMAYVMLGRTELLSDMYIAGDFNVDQIKCDQSALAESNRLLEIFDNSQKEQIDKRLGLWKISYLNVRSIKSADGHREDVRHDNFLMDADMFGLGETWLEKDDKVDFEGYLGYYASFGNGKGVAGYTKLNLISPPKTISSETYSAVFLRTNDFIIIFVYLSHNYKRKELFQLLDTWISEDVPTALIGDVNESLHKPFYKKMQSIGFEHLINVPTCETGSIIDNIFVNNAMKAKNVSTDVDATYYSDHDIVSLYIPK